MRANRAGQPPPNPRLQKAGEFYYSLYHRIDLSIPCFYEFGELLEKRAKCGVGEILLLAGFPTREIFCGEFEYHGVEGAGYVGQDAALVLLHSAVCAHLCDDRLRVLGFAVLQLECVADHYHRMV